MSRLITFLAVRPRESSIVSYILAWEHEFPEKSMWYEMWYANVVRNAFFSLSQFYRENMIPFKLF